MNGERKKEKIFEPASWKRERVNRVVLKREKTIFHSGAEQSCRTQDLLGLERLALWPEAWLLISSAVDMVAGSVW